MFIPEQYTFDCHSPTLAQSVFRAVFRTNFTQPGFALISMPTEIDSQSLRRFMVTLKSELSEMFNQHFQHPLAYLSLARFNQQVTTKFHLDGAPETAFLMLGYEPSDVDSRLTIADYSRAAKDLSINPQQFLEDYNPMFQKGEAVLGAYTTELTTFDVRKSQIVLINNSFAEYDGHRQQGVMHQATIVKPCPDKQRVINSTMLGLAEVEWSDKTSAEDVRRFQEEMPVAQGDYS